MPALPRTKLIAVLTCVLLFAVGTVIAKKPQAEARTAKLIPIDQPLTFAGLEFVPEKAQRISTSPGWSYTCKAQPNVRLIEHRAVPTSRDRGETIDYWNVYQRGELLVRYTESRRDGRYKWAKHGLEVAYFSDGSSAVSIYCDGHAMQDSGAKLPMQKYANQTCSPEE